MPPQRIQRRRTKGWRKPPNTVCIGRPGPWGNPFNSMVKFFVLGVLFGQVVAVSTDPAPDSAFAPSFFGRPPGQLP